jgi:hypothetical protein
VALAPPRAHREAPLVAVAPRARRRAPSRSRRRRARRVALLGAVE